VAVIALANGTYAPMTPLTGMVLKAVLSGSADRGLPAYTVALAPGAGAWPETLEAVTVVNDLLTSWDDAIADALFSENVALDGPYPERRRVIATIAERIGDFAVDDTRPAESETPAHRRWWLAGERGSVQAQIQLSPQRPLRARCSRGRSTPWWRG
jgi:hypothetical protein